MPQMYDGIDPDISFAPHARLDAEYSGLGGRDLLEPLITRIFPGRIALVSSFGAESVVLLHMVAAIDRATPVIFLNTGKLFGETLAYRESLAERFGLTDVRDIRPGPVDAARIDP
ncbi:MAG: phosphoadenosine phosphosulfate reductase family protein, partial [Methyloligellaceae bacterium]